MDFELELVIIPVTDVDRAKDFTLMRNPDAAGSVQGLHLVVDDIDEARAELTGRGVEASEIFHFGPAGQTPGHEPQRASYGSFLSFADPDGNGWLVQEVTPGDAAR